MKKRLHGFPVAMSGVVVTAMVTIIALWVSHADPKPPTAQTATQEQVKGERTVLLPAAVPEGPSRVRSQAAQKRPLPTAGRWKKVTSPQGRFSVELPEGWEIKPMSSEENPASFGPAGRNFPSVSINGWLTPEVIQMMVTGQSDNRFLCHQVSAKELYEQVLLPLLRQKLPDIRVERMTPTNPTTKARGWVFGNSCSPVARLRPSAPPRSPGLTNQSASEYNGYLPEWLSTDPSTKDKGEKPWGVRVAF